MTLRAHIGLGANLGDPAARLRWAIGHLAALGELEAQSRLYRSAPMGGMRQPDYCNAVAIVRVACEAPALMETLLGLERSAGRLRGEKWGPRTLDLDLLHVDGLTLETPQLTLPHPGIATRNFVLKPWAEIAPDTQVPGVGSIGERAAAIGDDGLALWETPG